MPKQSYSPEFYFERAEEMRSLADQMSDPSAKQQMIGVAESYERLAEHAQTRDTISAAIKHPEKIGS